MNEFVVVTLIGPARPGCVAEIPHCILDVTSGWAREMLKLSRAYRGALENVGPALYALETWDSIEDWGEIGGYEADSGSWEISPLPRESLLLQTGHPRLENCKITANGVYYIASVKREESEVWIATPKLTWKEVAAIASEDLDEVRKHFKTAVITDESE